MYVDAAAVLTTHYIQYENINLEPIAIYTLAMLLITYFLTVMMKCS